MPGVPRPRGADRRGEGDGHAIPPEVIELALAVQGWKARTGRIFPTFSELVDVLKGLGWTPPARPPHGASG